MSDLGRPGLAELTNVGYHKCLQVEALTLSFCLSVSPLYTAYLTYEVSFGFK